MKQYTSVFLISLIVYFVPSISNAYNPIFSRGAKDKCIRLMTLGFFGKPELLDGIETPGVKWGPYSVNQVSFSNALVGKTKDRDVVIVVMDDRVDVHFKTFNPYQPDKNVQSFAVAGLLEIQDKNGNPYDPNAQKGETEVIIKVIQKLSYEDFRRSARVAVSAPFKTVGELSW